MEENDDQGIPLRKVLLWGLVSVLALGVCVGSGLALWPRYKSWSSGRALKEANEAHLAGEYRRQQLFLEQAVQLDSSNLEARRQLASFTYQAGLPRAVELWVSLAEVEPGLLANHQGLVLALLRKGDVRGATEALARVPESLRGEADYRRVAAAVAMSAGNVAELELQLAALAKFESAPESLKLSRAALAMGSSDAAVKAAAQVQLIEMARQDAFRIRATLCLLRYMPPTQPGGQPSSEALAERIFKTSNQSSSLLPRVRPGLTDLLRHMMTQPAPKAEDAAELMQWMRLQGLAREALVWIEAQPESVRKAPQVLGERANSAMQSGQWQQLRESLAQGVWGSVPEEALTLVFAARIQYDRGSVANARATWSDAMALVERSPGAMRALYRLAQGWAWKGEAERCLQELVKYFPREDALWSALLYHAQMEGSADKTVQVLENWSRAQGQPARVYGEQMLVSVLLDRLNAEQDARLADLAAQAGATPNLRLAAALQRCRKRAELGPVVVPEGFEVSALTPRARLAWAILLLQAGKAEAAKSAVAGLGQVSFLPEEKMLLSRVQELRPVFNK